MKRQQYQIEVSGVIFSSKEQANAVVKALTSALAGIDVRGGITKVEIELKALRVSEGKRKKKNPPQAMGDQRTTSAQGELVK